MNIKDFLVDNYIYIIIVILLVIVTIIGFLADKKKNGDNSPKANKGNNGGNVPGGEPTMAAPINYQPVNNQMPSPGINVIPQNNTLNQVPNVMPQNNNPVVAPENNMNTQINPIGPMPVVNNPGVAIEPQGVNVLPAGPQPMTPMTPNIEPPQVQEINNPMMNNIPSPVEPINPNVGMNPEPMYQPLSEQKPTFAPTMQAVPNVMMNNVQVPPAPAPTPVMDYNVNNQIVPEPAPMMAPAQNVNMNAGPVMPGPIPNPTENTMPSPVTPPQPVTPTPVSFVYGGQNNNMPQ